METAISITSLQKKFQKPLSRKSIQALNGLSLNVQQGEIYGMIGPNGSGKSTALKILLGLLKANSGDCQIFGQLPTAETTKKLVGFLPENARMYPYFNAQELLDFYGKLHGLKRPFRQQKIQEMLKFFNIEEVSKRRLSTYSKGMLQRVGLCQALLHSPKLLILDEPLSGVDPLGAELLKSKLLQLKKQDITVLLASHQLEYLSDICDRVGLISEGKLIVEDRLENLLHQPERIQLQLETISKELLNQIKALVDADASAKWIKKTPVLKTLTQTFLDHLT